MSVEMQNKTVAEQEKSREIEETPISCKWCGGETHHVGSHFIGKKCSGIPKEHEGKTPNELMKIYVVIDNQNTWILLILITTKKKFIAHTKF